jgi:tetratricopeptide (TPR) repeat protein
MSLAQTTRIWLLAITLILGCAACFYLLFVQPFLQAQHFRDWERDRLEGQRLYVDSQYKLAQTAYKKALDDLSGENKHADELADTLNEYGRIEYLLNNLDQSEKEYVQAQSVYEKQLELGTTPDKNMRQLREEGLMRSLSGIARIYRARGQKDLAKNEYEILFPKYIHWWSSQVFSEVQPDVLHRSKHKKVQPQSVTKADPVICALMAQDLTDLASLYVNDADLDKAKKVTLCLSDLCSKAPIDNNLKAKADLVYHRAFELGEREPGIVNQM